MKLVLFDWCLQRLCCVGPGVGTVTWFRCLWLGVGSPWKFPWEGPLCWDWSFVLGLASALLVRVGNSVGACRGKLVWMHVFRVVSAVRSSGGYW